MPVTVILEVRQAGVPAVLAVHHVVRFTPGCRLVAAAGELAPLVPQGHQEAQVDGDVVGLAVVRILYLSLRAWTTFPRTPRTTAQGSHLRPAERNLRRGRVCAHAAPRQRRQACGTKTHLRKLLVHESKPKAVNREPAGGFRLSSLRVAHCVTSRSRIVLRTSNIPNCTPDGAVAMGAGNGSAGTRCPCANATQRNATQRNATEG